MHILWDNQTHIFGGKTVHIKNIVQPTLQQAIKLVAVQLMRISVLPNMKLHSQGREITFPSLYPVPFQRWKWERDLGYGF